VPAGDGIEVSPEDLIVHAGHLEGVADALAVARQAGDPAQIAAHVQTWRNVAASLRDEADSLIRASRLDVGANPVGR
jgi:hypothetical protein